MNIQHVKLGEVVSFNPRWRSTGLSCATEVAYVTLSALSASSAQVASETRRLDDIEPGYTHFQDGDILIASQLAALQTGKVAQARIPHAHGFCSKKLYVIRPDPRRIDARFLLHFLRQAQIRMAIARYLKNESGNHPSALDFLKNLSLMLPPLAQQKRLAAPLDLSFDCCATRRREIVTMDKMKQAHFIDAFGNTAAMFAKWPVSTLGQHLDHLILGSRRWSRHLASKGDFLIRRCNLGANMIVLDDMAYVRTPAGDAVAGFDEQRTRVMAGDVLMSMATLLGRTAVAPPDIGTAYVNQGVAILRTSTIEPVFLAAYLCSNAALTELERLKHPGLTPTLSSASIRAVRLPLPPPALQQQFALQADAFERERHTACARLVQEQARFASVERTAFNEQRPTGKRSTKSIFISPLLDMG
jgi:type I restriction enzyme S subunit